MIELGERLRAVAHYIESGCVMADIGCDHGRLSVGLLLEGKISKAVAIDRSVLSLEKAKRLAAKLHLQQRLDCRIGDGLDPLLPGEARAVVIAGMSGMKIRRIIERGAGKIGRDTRLILQPMQGQDVLRKALVEQGLHIFDEDLTSENGRLFDVIAAGRREAPPYDLRYADVGFLLWKKRHPLLKERVAHRLRIRNKLLRDLEASGRGTEGTLDKLKESARLYGEMLLWL